MVEIVGFECKILSLSRPIHARVLFKLFSHFNFYFIVVAVGISEPSQSDDDDRQWRKNEHEF